MYKITLDDPADDMLVWLKSRDKYMHSRIVNAIDEIEKLGTLHAQIKKLSHPTLFIVAGCDVGV